MTREDDQIWSKLNEHESRLIKIETYFKVIIGFGGITLPVLLYVALKIGYL